MNSVIKHFEDIIGKDARINKDKASLSDRGHRNLFEENIIDDNESLKGIRKEYLFGEHDFWFGNVNYHYGDKTGYIGWVKVHEDFQGNGLGKKIVEDCLDELLDKNVRKVFVDCKSKPMEKIVKKLDFSNYKGSWYVKEF